MKEHIQNSPMDQATEEDMLNHGEAKELVRAVFNEEKSSPKQVEAALKKFLGARKNLYREHGYWVHSLSHFTKILWQRRMDDWIKKYNEVAFKGADELHDSNCSNRLVDDFAKYARWDDDPKDFHLTPENLRWMDWKYAKYAKARIEAGHFESEEAFLRWKLRQTETLTYWDGDAQADLVNTNEIRSLIQQLQKLGADTSEFSGLESDLLTKQLNELEGKLPAATEDWQRKQLEAGIQETRKALASL